MYNKVILMGRICHDLELKTTQSGVPVLFFRIAVDRAFQAKGEERKADFFNLVAWRNTAEFINRYFSKGRMIMVDGELQNREYTDKNNVTRTVTEIIANSANFTGEPKSESAISNQAQNSSMPTPTVMSQGNSQDFVESASNDKDYPF